jgi:hypothetical protein
MLFSLNDNSLAHCLRTLAGHATNVPAAGLDIGLKDDSVEVTLVFFLGASSSSAADASHSESLVMNLDC